jgi:hypothetical protein
MCLLLQINPFCIKHSDGTNSITLVSNKEKVRQALVRIDWPWPLYCPSRYKVSFHMPEAMLRVAQIPFSLYVCHQLPAGLTLTMLLHHSLRWPYLKTLHLPKAQHAATIISAQALRLGSRKPLFILSDLPTYSHRPKTKFTD